MNVESFTRLLFVSTFIGSVFLKPLMCIFDRVFNCAEVNVLNVYCIYEILWPEVITVLWKLFWRHCSGISRITRHRFLPINISYYKVCVQSWLLQLNHTKLQMCKTKGDTYFSPTRNKRHSFVSHKNWFYRNRQQQWCLSKQRPNAKIIGGQVDSRWWQETEKSQERLAKHLHNQTKSSPSHCNNATLSRTATNIWM